MILSSLLAHQGVALIIFAIGMIAPMIMGIWLEYWRSRKGLTCGGAMVIVGMVIIVDGAFAVSSSAMIIYAGCFVMVMLYNLGDRVEHIKTGALEIGLDEEGNTNYRRTTDAAPKVVHKDIKKKHVKPDTKSDTEVMVIPQGE